VERTTFAAGIGRDQKDWKGPELALDKRDVIILKPGEALPPSLSESLEAKGWVAHAFSDPQEALRLLKIKPVYVGIAVLGSGFDEAAQNEMMEILGQSPTTEWIAVVEPGMIGTPGQSAFIRDFFFDFHTAPIDLNRFLFSLGHAYGTARLGEAGQEEFRTEAHHTFGLVGSSRAMCRVFSDMEKISRSDEPVIIAGETGTGKELVARAIHGQSKRAGHPFVVVNCGAIPETLVQSELFGHTKGAFTGAAESRIGYLESAAGGTVFLDGIEDLSPLGQVSLLRFLQEKTVTRVGGKDTVPVDVRIIASARPTLMASVKRGEVREDLFYRLNVLQIDVPPLRDRGADSVEIAEYIIHRFNRERKRDSKRLARNAIDRILEYPWPGNVRELVACINRAAVLSSGRLITMADLGLPAVVKFSGKTLREIKSHAVEQALLGALAETRSISSAARQLGVSRVTLYRLMEKHSIRTPGMAGMTGSLSE
jgi:DNA-binding NtrC family response regulator